VVGGYQQTWERKKLLCIGRVNALLWDLFGEECTLPCTAITFILCCICRMKQPCRVSAKRADRNEFPKRDESDIPSVIRPPCSLALITLHTCKPHYCFSISTA
jgi:hypothetical protein